MGTDPLVEKHASLMENGLYRCNQCGRDIKEEDFDMYDRRCYTCIDTYEEDFEDDDDYDDGDDF